MMRKAIVVGLCCFLGSWGALRIRARSVAGQEDLKPVLAAMSLGSASFKSAKADFEWVNYTKVVDVKDVQNGRIYFRRRGGDDPDVALHIESPAVKQVVYQKGIARIYEPKIDQLTEREVGKNKADVDAVISLGFGGSPDELTKDFEVTMDGWETLDHVKTAKLELVAKRDSLKKLFSKVILWIDPARDVPLQQQWFFEPSGDYKLTRYTNIKVNAKVPDDDFKLHTTSKTKVVKIQ
jgi:outer membrane lipoprotein-sorting protein